MPGFFFLYLLVAWLQRQTQLQEVNSTGETKGLAFYPADPKDEAPEPKRVGDIEEGSSGR